MHGASTDLYVSPAAATGADTIMVVLTGKGTQRDIVATVRRRKGLLS